MSNETLVIRCQPGERAAFAELVRAWHPAVERYVARMLNGPDDDVVQEVWLAVVKGLPKLRQPGRFAPWLFTIARRAVMNRLREAYAHPEPEPVDDPPGPDETEEIVDRETLAGALAPCRVVTDQPAARNAQANHPPRGDTWSDPPRGVPGRSPTNRV
jgi:RNA polymerase sigma factor (sigma-70 family)